MLGEQAHENYDEAAMSAQTHTTVEAYGTFPPITAGDWRNMYYDSPLVINHGAAQMVYDVCWFLVKDETEALRLTVVTLRIAVSRYNVHALPPPAAYTAWLASIASNEAHQFLESVPGRRTSSALLDAGDNVRAAYYIADTLAEMRADYKLALILRYRYDTSPLYLSHALDRRPRKVARLFVKAREEFAAASSMKPQMLLHAQPPRSADLAQVVEPYSKREMSYKVLGYDWRESDFPVIPEREEKRSKWITLLIVAIILIVISSIVTRPWSALRPMLVDPAQVEEPLDQ